MSLRFISFTAYYQLNCRYNSVQNQYVTESINKSCVLLSTSREFQLEIRLGQLKFAAFRNLSRSYELSQIQKHLEIQVNHYQSTFTIRLLKDKKKTQQMDERPHIILFDVLKNSDYEPMPVISGKWKVDVQLVLNSSTLKG